MAGAANSINELTTGISGFTGTAFVGTAATQYAVLVGGSTSSTLSNVGPTATAGQVLQSAGNAANPAFSTATYPATATGTGTILRADGTNWVATSSTYPNTNAVSTLLYASASNVMSALATANRAVLTTGTTGVPVLTALATDGQLIIGSTAGAPAAATISAGAGISVTNASNSITIAATSTGMTWSVITADQTAAVNHGYFCNKASLLTLTLPTTTAVGDTIAVVNINGAAFSKILSANPGTINFGNVAATANTGSLTSTALGDVIFLVAENTTSVWYCYGAQGNWTIA